MAGKHTGAADTAAELGVGEKVVGGFWPKTDRAYSEGRQNVTNSIANPHEVFSRDWASFQQGFNSRTNNGALHQAETCWGAP